MKFIRGIHNYKNIPSNVIATIGNFDGIHLGHQFLLQELVARAQAQNKPSLVMIFSPHPLTVIKPAIAPLEIMQLRSKYKHIAEHGIDYLLCIKFNKELANVTAHDFVQKLLIDKLKVSHLIIGHDFHFGRAREGNYQFLQQQQERYNFTLTPCSEFKYKDIRVSSTYIRGLIKNNNFANVRELLGRNYSISGKVSRGKQIGRTLGYPTANIAMHGIKFVVDYGIYVVLACFDNAEHHAVASLGIRPSVDSDSKAILEVFILSGEHELYGKRLKVEFLHKIRDEAKFNSLAELKANIADDCQQAREFFELNQN